MAEGDASHFMEMEGLLAFRSAWAFLDLSICSTLLSLARVFSMNFDIF